MERDDMPKILNDVVKIRDRNEITLPKKIRKFLGVVIGDTIEFEVSNNGCVKIHKVVYTRVKNQIDKNSKQSEERKHPCGEERKDEDGGGKNEQMGESVGCSEKTKRNTLRLPIDQGKQDTADKPRTSDQTTEEIKNTGGEDESLL